MTGVQTCALPIFFSPKEGDPADYVKVVMEDGEEVTITNTCAANVLGLEIGRASCRERV